MKFTGPDFNCQRFEGPSRSLPTGQAGDAGGVGVLKWRMQSADESMVPLSIYCWPSVSGNETYVSMEYEALSMFDQRNVVISVPLLSLRETPSVRQIDGTGVAFLLIFRYDSRNFVLEWSILLIYNSNSSVSWNLCLQLIHQLFLPISVQFSAASTCGDLKIRFTLQFVFVPLSQ
ncbi:hypothetical protein Pint_12178 [Pistacia integerrima]|uniref:Uncharacterized protein n=1 Tax=Pistacia integerrima TaxID=434235 RepID=A0ACC0XEA9_9ROSI|nr:hypothetical protein Pint_12178 [Pistacia integerrima]